jgi:hypothetical protein
MIHGQQNIKLRNDIFNNLYTVSGITHPVY